MVSRTRSSNTYPVRWTARLGRKARNCETYTAQGLLHRLALFAAEQAKIELSSQEETTIRMDEGRLRSMDRSGEEIYIDIPITCDDLNSLIAELVADTITVTRDTLKRVSPQMILKKLYLSEGQLIINRCATRFQ